MHTSTGKTKIKEHRLKEKREKERRAQRQDYEDARLSENEHCKFEEIRTLPGAGAKAALSAVRRMSEATTSLLLSTAFGTRAGLLSVAGWLLPELLFCTEFWVVDRLLATMTQSSQQSASTRAK